MLPHVPLTVRWQQKEALPRPVKAGVDSSNAALGTQEIDDIN